MEIIQPYIGKHDGSSVFLNHGKYGPYLNYKDKLYSVPLAFRTPKFNLNAAIKIIDFKNKWSENKKNEFVNGETEKDSTCDNIRKLQAATTYEKVDDIVKNIKNKKSL
jgi:hypothetical protein